MLKANDVATFKTFDGRYIVGRVVSVLPNCYAVLALKPFEICATYGDGLFRFTDRNVV